MKTTVTTDRAIVRDSAKRVAEIANLPEQQEKVRLWKACNDLQPERAMVLATQQPWDELDSAWVTLECQDPAYREMELRLKRLIVRHEHIPDDFPILNLYRVMLRVSGIGYGDYGVDLKQVNSEDEHGSYRIENAIENEADLSKLHPRPVRIEQEATEQAMNFTQEAIGDILHVTCSGRPLWRYGLTRVLIHMRGLGQMMLDMYDNPKLIHRLMAFLRDDFLRELDILEADGGILPNAAPDHVTGSGGLSPTSDLPSLPCDVSVSPRECFCWAESQETVGVSPAMFEEFVLQYQRPIMERFGLVDYGCCEALHDRLPLIMQYVPNLRWVAVSPWAERRKCAEFLGKKYVYVYKPNPSTICAPVPDWNTAQRDIRVTLAVARDCPTHICMKDTQTFCREPQRITQWCEMAVNVAKEMA